MSESAPIPPDERFDVVARSRVGGVRVEQFEGLRAGEAIASARRLGLRPTPERVEGYEPDLHGFVVGQEPGEGGELQAGEQVVLFIAAPSRARVEGDDRQPAGDEAGQVSAPDAASLPHVEGVDVEALRVGDRGYADETVEVHELAAPSADWPSQVDEPFEDFELDPAPRRGERRALIAAGRSRWRSLPATTRWIALGIGVCLALIVVAALPPGRTSAPRSSVRGASPGGRPVEVARRQPKPLVAVEPAAGRPAVRAARCHGCKRWRGRSASRVRMRLVYVSDANVASASAAVHGTEADGTPAVESAEEHAAREFGGP